MSTSQRIADKVEGIAPPLPVFCMSHPFLCFFPRHLVFIPSRCSPALTIKLSNPPLLNKSKYVAPAIISNGFVYTSGQIGAGPGGELVKGPITNRVVRIASFYH